MTLAVVAASGCATTRAARPPAPAATDTVKLLAIAPDPGVKLHPGETVVFRAKLVTTLATADVGHVSLVIQDNRGRNLKKNRGPQARMGVGRGTEHVELWDDVVIGIDAKWVDVFTPLFSEAGKRTSVVERVRFQIVR